MIPNKVKISGYKRFKEASVYLDKKLLAFVGANEAGKSSFLEVLQSLENKNPYTKDQLTYDLEREDEDVVVRAEYLLEKKEMDILKSMHGAGTPRFYFVEKQINGELIHGFIGDIERNKSARKEIVALASKLLKGKSYSKFLDNNRISVKGINEDDPKEESSDTIRAVIQEFIESLKKDDEELSLKTTVLLEQLQNYLSIRLKYSSKLVKDLVAKLLNQFVELKETQETEHPENAFLVYCDKHRPEFTLFGDAERHLKGSYDLTELETPVAALQNILTLSKVSSGDILKAINDEDSAKRHELEKIANDNLKAEFKSWSQSDVFPQIHLDPNAVKVHIESSKRRMSQVNSRSDGFRQYIALKTFLAVRKLSNPPVLLIDEAETHLHYAAQSNLIVEFEKQKDVNSIIYTTHSAGCLPNDLGTGLRAVEAIREKNEDTGTSTIKNSIWTNNGGFSPILMAMGANIIAFTLARKAVFAEGACETILLPRILREATGKDFLEFQVAPGIASVAPSEVKEFELEAAKVAYVVDGDEGGKKNLNKLLSAGIERSKILQLEKGCCIEDYVSPEFLVEAVNLEFNQAGRATINCDVKKLPEKGRLNRIEKICQKVGNDLPNKTSIANNLSNRESSVSIIDRNKKKFLQDLYNNLDVILS